LLSVSVVYSTRLKVIVTLICLLLAPSLFAAKKVHFKDPKLEAVVRKYLHIPTGHLTVNDLANLESLYAEGEGITDLTGLEAAVNLYWLHLGYNPLTNFVPLENLPQLSHLYIPGVPIKTLPDSLARMTDLYDIEAGPGVTNISVITQMRYIADLTLHESPIAAFPIREFPYLRKLTLYSCGLTNIDFITNCPALRRIDLGRNQITDISPLRPLTNTYYLDLSYNRIRDVTPLENLHPELMESLALRWNCIDLNRESPSRAIMKRFWEADPGGLYFGQAYPPRLHIRKTAEGAEVDFDGDPEVFYWLETSSEVTDWPIVGGFAGTAFEPTRFTVSSSSNAFFRLLVVPPR
jgi:hypothetical protein